MKATSDPDCYHYAPVAPEVDEVVAGTPAVPSKCCAARTTPSSTCGSTDDGHALLHHANPNTAFGPDPGLPMTEVLLLHGVKFSKILASLMTKHAHQIYAPAQPS